MVMDLRNVPYEGIPVQSGDHLRISEIWYYTRSTDDTAFISVASYLSSGSYDGTTLFETDASVFRNGVHNLLSDSPFDWDVGPEKNLLIITLSKNSGQYKSIILDLYEIPLSSTAPVGLIPVPAPRAWPKGDMTYLDFENALDLEEWVADEPVQFNLSDKVAISGKQSLATTILTIEPNVRQETVVRTVPFQASMIIGQVYWPSRRC